MTVMLTQIFQGVLREQENWASTMILGFIASFNNNVIYIYIFCFCLHNLPALYTIISGLKESSASGMCLMKKTGKDNI